MTSPITRLIGALGFAAHKHRDQRRKDVEALPYINHPIALARVLSVEAGIDEVEVLCAALLHDTIEDTETTVEELHARFGERVASIVLEVTDDTSPDTGAKATSGRTRAAPSGRPRSPGWAFQFLFRRFCPAWLDFMATNQTNDRETFAFVLKCPIWLDINMKN